MESRVSLERGVCSCAELQVFSCYGGWKEACQATRTISTTWSREVSSFSFLLGKAPKEIHAILIEALEEHAPSYATVKNWVAQFKRGDFSTCSGRPKTVTTPEIIDKIHELILEDRRISAKSIAEQLGISREQFGSIIYEDLDMRKLSAKWVSKCLNADQKRQLCQSSEQLWEFFRRSTWFPVRLVAMDENWLYHYDPETKQWSMEWRHSGSHPPPKKFWAQKSAGKFLVSIFWDQDRILLIDYLPKGQNINAEYHSSLLVQLKGILKEGSCSWTTMLRFTGHLQPRRNWPTWASNVLITHPILRIWPLRTTTCSLDWKKQLEVHHFSSDAEVIAAAETWLDGQQSEFFWVAYKS